MPLAAQQHVSRHLAHVGIDQLAVHHLHHIVGTGAGVKEAVALGRHFQSDLGLQGIPQGSAAQLLQAPVALLQGQLPVSVGGNDFGTGLVVAHVVLLSY